MPKQPLHSLNLHKTISRVSVLKINVLDQKLQLVKINVPILAVKNEHEVTAVFQHIVYIYINITCRNLQVK